MMDICIHQAQAIGIQTKQASFVSTVSSFVYILFLISHLSMATSVGWHTLVNEYCTNILLTTEVLFWLPSPVHTLKVRTLCPAVIPTQRIWKLKKALIPRPSRVLGTVITVYWASSGFGGLEVTCWSLVPKFAAEVVGFFRAKKSSARLPSEGK